MTMPVYDQTLTSPTPRKNKDEHVFSLNKRVKISCDWNKESSAKIANILYYFYLVSIKEGGDGIVWTDSKTLSRLSSRSGCTVGRNLRQLEVQGFIIVERIRGKNHKILFRITLTEKLLDIKNGGKRLEGNTIDLYKQNACENNRCEPRLSKPDRPISAPIMISKYIVQLNLARARKTNQENLSKNEYTCDKSIPVPTPLPPKPDIPLPSTETSTNASVFFAEEALKAVKEILLPALEHSVTLVEKVFKKAIGKLQRSHFGDDPVVALERFRDYLTKVANNPFLTGKKAMKSLDLFLISIGFLLTPKTIEDSWHNAGFFDIWEEKPPFSDSGVPHPGVLDQGISYQEIRKIQGSEPDHVPTLPPLSLEEVLTTAENGVDREVKRSLYQTLGAVTYRAWIYTNGFMAKGFSSGLTEGEMDFEINSGFARDYVLTHYGQALRKAFASVLMH
ncbi:hypothetical protein [Candidatus Finniella inopinata]|uniref:Helix-turn-helix domain-containing protein n=1 Tax=Candidatus Finniella inopinata TaxID=1696036 RepID=A0A4V2DZH8_9PROT|nr:hypothetical protein [Candidatus Finniella inopinata]RZI45107.1 hypothetical protein EQU50_08200 [Candidatus Finniella inopinata]